MVYHHLYKIWLFSLVDQYGSFKEAAQHAGITRSALSQNLSVLEEYFKCSLLVREKNGVHLTQEGAHLLEKIKPILVTMSEIGDVSKVESSLKGYVHLGAYESIAIQFSPSVFKNFKTLYPKLKLEISTNRSESLIKSVKNGSLDLALVINGESDNKVEVDHILEDELGLYISESNYYKYKKLQNMKSIGVAMLSTPNEGLPLYYKKFLKKIPKDIVQSLSSDSFEAIRSLALSGCVMGLLPQRVAMRSQGGERLKRVWPEVSDEVNSQHNVSLVYRKNIDRRIVDLVKKSIV